MKTRILSGLALVVVIVLIFQINDCSLIGLGIGIISDASKWNQITNIPGWPVETIGLGTRIDLVLKNGEKISGKYAGLDRVAVKDYPERYAKSREQMRESIVLPALGDTINSMGKVGFGKESYRGKFLGFDGPPLQPVLVLEPFKKIEPKVIRLVLGSAAKGAITQIRDLRGNDIEVEKVLQFISEGKLPLLSAIVVESDTGKLSVSVDQVQQIQVPPVKKLGALIGFLAGAVIDVLTVVSIRFY